MMNKNYLQHVVLCTGLVLGLTLISGARARAAAPNAAEGAKIYDSKCAKCHGATGAGDGKSAKKLDTKPTALNDPSIFTDKKKTPELTPEARLILAIKKGGEAVKQSKEMPDYPTLTDDQIADMMAHIKTFKK